MSIHDDAQAAFRAVYDGALSDKEQEVSDLSETVLELKSELASVTDQRDRALTDIAGYILQIEECSSESAQNATEIARLNSEIGTLLDRVKELEAQLEPAPPVRPEGPGFVKAESLSKKATLTATYAAAPSGSQITLGVDTVEFGDFTMYDTRTVGGYGLGLYLVKGLRGLRGSGIDKSIVRQTKGVSTRRSQVPPNPPAGTVNYLNAGTNNLNYVRLGNNDGPVTVTDLTIQGTDQGHEYNGLLIPEAPESIIERVKITGIPGSASANPGETFSLSLYRSHKTTVRNVEVDGRRDGVAVAAAAVGVNFSDNVVIEDTYLHDTKYGHGVAWFTCSNAHMRRVKFRNIGGEVAANFERMSGTVTLEKCDFGPGGRQAHMMLQSDTTSSVVKIIDPIFEGAKFNLRTGGGYQGNPNKQNVADIKLIVNGTERPDLLNIMR